MSTNEDTRRRETSGSEEVTGYGLAKRGVWCSPTRLFIRVGPLQPGWYVVAIRIP